AVLDGGWARWTALGLPVESGAPQAVAMAPSRLSPAATLDADEVQVHLDAGGLLVDARGAPRFRGEVEPIDRVAGHVPGAVNRPFQENLQPDGTFKTTGELADEFQTLLAGREPSGLVSMCGSGVTACHNLLAMTHAGLPMGRLYAGAWSGWRS